MTAKQELPILITGGGIGGLALGVALARKNIPVTIVEQSEYFLEIGAGVQLGPNATRLLHAWDCAPELEKCAVEPDGIEITDGGSEKVLNRLKLAPDSRDLFNAPYYTIHRADLHNVLLGKVKEHRNVTLINNFRMTDYKNLGPGEVQITSDFGSHENGRLLVGADGVWSQTRTQIHPDIQPQYSNKVAWRALVPMDTVPNEFRRNVVKLYLGKNNHLVHYPVKKGKMLNIVAIISDHNSPGRAWENQASLSRLTTAFSSWSPHIKNFLNTVQTWSNWALYDHLSPARWVDENVVLLGDAAHPILPFMAQGAVMALEDAHCLANHIEQNINDPRQALLNYQNERQPRVLRVQKLSRRLGSIYHLWGPMAFMRNLVISTRSSRSMLQDYRWLYGHGQLT